MELTNDFTVNAPIDKAFATLTDLETIAPCMPGAQLTEIEGDVYRGLVKVKVGPITAQFKGQARFVEKDEADHRAVLKAEGRDTGGKGNASALITASLEALEPDVTKVTVATELTITGKVAQFGRGALADVSDKLLRQFVQNLESTVLTNGGTPVTVTEPAEPTAAAAAAAPTEAVPSEAAPGEPAPAEAVDAGPGSTADPAPLTTPSTPAPADTGIRKVEPAPVEPIDLLETAGAPMAKRLLPVLGGVVLLLIVWRVFRRRG
jgi:carbon monoxide dehydrogenase subunit G